MKHEDIVKEIYERHKDRLTSEKQVRSILFVAFRVFKSLMLKSREFEYKGLFQVRHTMHSWPILMVERHKYQNKMMLIVRKRRLWHKEIIDKDFK